MVRAILPLPGRLPVVFASLEAAVDFVESRLPWDRKARSTLIWTTDGHGYRLREAPKTGLFSARRIEAYCVTREPQPHRVSSAMEGYSLNECDLAEWEVPWQNPPLLIWAEDEWIVFRRTGDVEQYAEAVDVCDGVWYGGFDWSARPVLLTVDDRERVRLRLLSTLPKEKLLFDLLTREIAALKAKGDLRSEPVDSFSLQGLLAWALEAWRDSSWR